MALASMPFKTKTSFPATFEVIQSCTLQFNDMANGNNKFYVLKLHKAGNEFRLYSCYGRTGKEGVKEERHPEDEYRAKKEFEAIKNSKIKKGYREVFVAATSKGTEEGNKKILSDDVRIKPIQAPTLSHNRGSLHPAISSLVKRLYEEAGQTCQKQLSGRLETSAKNPLGTLTLTQINTGKSVLQQINNELLGKPLSGDFLNDKIIQLSSEYYASIPQEIPLRPRDEYGRQRWLNKYCLNTPGKLDEQRDLLDLLSDVQGMISGFDSDDILTKYEQIYCTFEYLPETDDQFKFAKNFVVNSQSKHHGWKLNVKNVWRVDSKAQSNYIDTLTRIGNINKLFHGSRAAN